MKRLNFHSISTVGLALLASGWAFGALAQNVSPVGAQSAPVQVQSGSPVAPGPEYGRVISTTAIQTQVNVPRQVCGTEQVVTPAQKSGAGAAIGAIAGGAVGNSMGQGSGRAVATAIGLVGGAILGDKIEGPSTAQSHNVERCVTQNTVEYRTTGYNVIYEYAGRQYSVQMPNDPGQWIKLQITPAAVQNQSAAPYAAVMAAAPVTTTVVRSVVVEPAVVYAPVPVYAAPPVVVGTSFYYGRPHFHGPRTGVGVSFNYGYPHRWY